MTFINFIGFVAVFAVFIGGYLTGRAVEQRRRIKEKSNA